MLVHERVGGTKYLFSIEALLKLKGGQRQKFAFVWFEFRGFGGRVYS
jgi:hypothetical protein